MTSTGLISHLFHGIATINNHGISLMKQRNHVDAKKTFQDALSLIKQTVNTMEFALSDEEDIQDFSEVSKFLEDKVQVASNRMYHSHQTKQEKNVNGYHATNEDPVALHVVTYSALYGVEENELGNGNDATNGLKEFYVIRTEVDDPIDNDISILESLLDIMTAMIMYNMGVANLLMACQVGTGEDLEESRCAVKTLLTRTLQIFKLSHSLLRDMVDMTGSSTFGEDITSSLNSSSCCIYIGMYKGAVIAEVIVLRTLMMIQMFLDVDCHTELHRLHELLQTIHHMEKSCYIFDPILLNAPAA